LADVNADGDVNIKDATVIQMYLAGMISTFSKATEPPTTQAVQIQDEDSYYNIVVKP
jgi:hypothetical protein